jgi:glutamate dehydrogenase (NADP+)
MYGQYKRITKQWDGVLTGKGFGWGGSLIRPEATGYGSIYFALEMLGSLEGRKLAISGSGNVAQYAAEKGIDCGAKVVTFSDSGGSIHVPDGITSDMLSWIMDLKNVRRGRISEVAEHFSGVEYRAGVRPWDVPCDVAVPSATQNELDGSDAKALKSNGCIAVVEGANMPSTPEAINLFHDQGIAFGPAKAANAGGVATSALEMTQNASFDQWTREEVDTKLHNIMKAVHSQCADAAERYDMPGNLQAGANIAGFEIVANAMLAQGVV